MRRPDLSELPPALRDGLMALGSLASADDWCREWHGLPAAELVSRLIDVDLHGRAVDVQKLHINHGVPVEILAHLYGCTVDECHRLIDQSMLEPTRYTVARLHAKGMSPLQISEETGIQRTTLYRWLDDMGLKPHATFTKGVSKYMEKRVVDLYNEGLTRARIEKETKLTNWKVTKILERARIDGRIQPRSPERVSNAV